MTDSIESFLFEIPEPSLNSPAALIDYFLYFLTIIKKEESVTPSQIEGCFEEARITKYSNTSAYLGRHSRRGGSGKFIKTKFGYQLSRTAQIEIQKTLRTGPEKLETSHLLRELLSKVTNSNEKDFLKEVIDCYEIGARRASITMMWILTLSHLFSYVLKHKQTEFNLVLSANTDKRVKITSVSITDDFSDIPESKFIEFLRSAKIISGDIRKILDTKLGIRNTSAHPSAIVISQIKATDFIIDLVENVISKYEI